MTPAGGEGTAASTGADEVVYRGVRWRRSASGRMMWFNDGLKRWVLWAPDADAPPVPEGWDAAGAVDGTRGTPGNGSGITVDPYADRPRPQGLWRYLSTDSMARRPPMRSPYRIAPLVLVALIIIVAAYQATRPAAHASKQDIAAAEALKGDCLVKSGGTALYPDFSPKPVSCTAPNAFVKVIAVVLPLKGAACPAGSVGVRALDNNLAGEPVECVVKLALP